MSEENRDNRVARESEEPSFSPETDYEVPGSLDKPVPRWLLWTYATLPIWGLITFYFYWNGSYGWLDRGYWKQLQIASNTTFPVQNQDMPTGKPEVGAPDDSKQRHGED